MAKIALPANLTAWRRSLDILRSQLGKTLKAVNEAESGLAQEVQKLIDDGALVTTDQNLVANLGGIKWDEVDAVGLKAAADLSDQIFLSKNIEPVPVNPEDD